MAKKNLTPLVPAIALYSGEYFNFADPYNSEFQLIDIACGLASLCRFRGQLFQNQDFYSVAEHSVHVSNLCDTPEGKKYGLLHDASEAFLGEIGRAHV